MEIGDKVYSTFEHHQVGHKLFGKEFRKIDNRIIVKKTFIPSDNAPRDEDYYIYTLDNGNEVASFFCTNKQFLK